METSDGSAQFPKCLLMVFQLLIAGGLRMGNFPEKRQSLWIISSGKVILISPIQD
jgi:hypothetical protein